MKRTGVVRAEQSETQVTTEAVGGHEEADKDEEIKAQEHEENEEQKEEYSHWERENDIKPALVEGVSFDQVFKWYTVADLRVFLRKQGLSAAGKKVELVQHLIDHLNSGFFPASSYGETESEEEEEEQEEAEEGRKATSKGEQESDGEEESDDPELNNLLRRMGDRCKERKSGLPMKEIDQFERELQTKLGNDVRIPHELRQLYRFCNGLECMGLSILPLDAALRAEQREGFDDVDLADDCSAMNHPAWIPFAEDHEFEVYFINTNLRSRTFGEIILWTINCGDEDHKARSLYHFLSILRRERRDW